MENQLKFFKAELILLIICILFGGGCGKRDSNHIDLKTNRYKADLKIFPPYFVDFFPDTLSDIYSIEENIDITNGCVFYINFDFNFTPEKGQDYLYKYKDIIKESFMANDSSVFVIKRRKLRDQTLKVNNFTNKIYPIPYFEEANYSDIGVEDDIYSSSTESGLSEKFRIYVLDSQPGKYWTGLIPQDYMPQGWKNGFSKGFCINQKKNIIIYWIVIW